MSIYFHFNMSQIGVWQVGGIQIKRYLSDVQTLSLLVLMTLKVNRIIFIQERLYFPKCVWEKTCNKRSIKKQIVGTQTIMAFSWKVTWKVTNALRSPVANRPVQPPVSQLTLAWKSFLSPAPPEPNALPTLILLSWCLADHTSENARVEGLLILFSSSQSYQPS